MNPFFCHMRAFLETQQRSEIEYRDEKQSPKHNHICIMYLYSLFSPAPVSLSQLMCIDGSGIQEPPKGEEVCGYVPRILCGWPPLFSTTCIQYCQTDCEPPLALSLSLRGQLKSEPSRGGGRR